MKYVFDMNLTRKTINGTANSVGQTITFPTAPMYHKENYRSAKCRMWLKTLRCGNDNVVSTEFCIHDYAKGFPVLRVNTPSQNNFQLEYTTDNDGATAVSGFNPPNRVSAGQPTDCIFPFTLDKNCICNDVSGNSGLYPNVLVRDAVGTGSGTGAAPGVANAPAVSMYGNTPLFTTFVEDNLTDANCSVINAPWGTRMDIDLIQFSLLNDLRNHRAQFVIPTVAGNPHHLVYVRLVVEPIEDNEEPKL